MKPYYNNAAWYIPCGIDSVTTKSKTKLQIGLKTNDNNLKTKRSKDK